MFPPLIRQLRRVAPLLLLIVPALVLLAPALLEGRTLVPGNLLAWVAPWTNPASQPPWNPLAYDSVGQFYPWRMFAAQSLHAGAIPLWNPWQLCGTPFLANSQSAPLYPGNITFYLLPPWAAFAVSAFLHLVVAAVGTYLFMRANGAARSGAVFAGIVYAYCTWQVAWLELPTFLCTACWMPVVLTCLFRLAETPGAGKLAKVAAAVGMALLGGHLQIAFYVIGTGFAYACLLAIGKPVRFAASAVCALLLGALVAAPQVLPALEFSRLSHRAGKPTSQGYAAYTAYSVNSSSSATLFVPDYFGNPSNPQSPYHGVSKGGMYFNYAEGAMYVGLITLPLAVLGVASGTAGRKTRLFLLGAAVVSVAIALGTPVDAALYFILPGFAQSGSPGRSLVVWAFAAACLAGFGTHRLITARRASEWVWAPTGVVAAAAVALALGGVAREQFNTVAWQPQFMRQTALAALAVAGMALVWLRGRQSGLYRLLPAGLVAVDLLAAGITFNATATPQSIYPQTQLTQFLQQRQAHNRVMPVNGDWSFAGPTAVLPPNAATALGLRDVQGYDSLLSGAYKRYMNNLSTPPKDSSPPEVGNMVFARGWSNGAAADAGVRWLVLPGSKIVPGGIYMDSVTVAPLAGGRGRAWASAADNSPATVDWVSDTPTRVTLNVLCSSACTLHLADEQYPGWICRVDGVGVHIQTWKGAFRQVALAAGLHRVAFTFQPNSFRVGVFCCLVALTALVSMLVYSSAQGAAAKRWRKEEPVELSPVR